MLTVDSDEAFLTKYGLKPNDAILAEPQHLSIYEELLSRDAKLIAGGAAQNSARGAQVSSSFRGVIFLSDMTFQYILPPNSTVYIGCVGNDNQAQTLRDAA